MSLRAYWTEAPSRLAWRVERGWHDLCLRWYRADKWLWALGVTVGILIAMFAALLQTVFEHRIDRHHLACLARNVYFEARGEPMAGQYAVAEVTMNRKASGLYPDTVCGVVYQKNWDPLRRRYVGAFSWTEFSEISAPAGEEWLRAWKVADAVYYRREPPVLEGALFYHAIHIKPSWAASKQPLARIGRHVFYK